MSTFSFVRFSPPTTVRVVLQALLVSFIACTQSASGTPLTQPIASTPTSQVEVVVSQIRNARGVIGCRLFSSKQGFPDSEQSYAGILVPIAANHATCLFRNLPAGTYAIAVMHDENNNGKLDTNFFGAPKEGYGVSNNHTYAMSSPKWDESRFTLSTNEKKQLNITLRY